MRGSSVRAAALFVDICMQTNQRIAQSLTKKVERERLVRNYEAKHLALPRRKGRFRTHTAHMHRTGGCCCGGVAWVTCCLLFSQGMLTRRRRLLQVHEYFRRHAAVLNAALAFVHALSQKGFFPASVKYYCWRSISRRAPLSAAQNVHE